MPFLMHVLSCLQSCKVHTDTVITCPSPAASNITAGSKPAPVDFYLNGRLYTDDRPALDEEMYPEEALHISKFSLEYYADPQFFTAKKEKWIKHHPGEPLTLVIHVREQCLQLCFFGCCLLLTGKLCSPKEQCSICLQMQWGERWWVRMGAAGVVLRQLTRGLLPLLAAHQEPRPVSAGGTR